MNTGHGAPKSHRAKQSPSNPFRPGANTPAKSPGGSNFKSRHQNPQVLRSSTPGKQLVPVSNGRSEFRLPNKRQGFAGIARKTREDKHMGRKAVSGTVAVL